MCCPVRVKGWSVHIALTLTGCRCDGSDRDFCACVCQGWFASGAKKKTTTTSPKFSSMNSLLMTFLQGRNGPLVFSIYSSSPFQPTHMQSPASFKVLSKGLVLLFILQKKKSTKTIFSQTQRLSYASFISLQIKKKHLDSSGLKWSQEIPRVRQHFLPPFFKNVKLKAVYEIFSGATNTAPCEPLFWQECFFPQAAQVGKKRIINVSYF